MNKKHLSRIAFTALAFFGTVSFCLCRADTLKTSTGTLTGTFQGYEKNEFLFTESGGTQHKIPKAKVTSVEVDQPCEARLRRSGKSTIEAVSLIGYDKLQFSFETNGKRFPLSAMNVTSLSVFRAMAGGGEEGPDDSTAFIAPIDTSSLENRTDLTPTQQAALQRYKTARKNYDDFVSRSTDLMTTASTAQGPKRAEILTELRKRKQEEQPVKAELQAAGSALLNECKDVPAAVKEQSYTEPEPSQRGRSALSAFANMQQTTTEDFDILILDTTDIKNNPSLTDLQKQALASYDKAVENFKACVDEQEKKAKAVNTAPASSKEAAMQSFQACEKNKQKALNALLSAQEAFLQAFPHIKVAQ